MVESASTTEKDQRSLSTRRKTPVRKDFYKTTFDINLIPRSHFDEEYEERS